MLIVAALALTNLLNSSTTAPLEAFIQISHYLGPRNPNGVQVTNAATLLLYISMNASNLIMLGLTLNQYIAVRFPHKYQTMVTKKVVAIYIAVAWSFSILSPLIQALCLPMGVVSQLQLHLNFELISLLLCVVYVTLHLAYLRQRRQVGPQPNDAMSANRSVCRRVRGLRDRQFTTANLFLLVVTILFSLIVGVAWHVSVYGNRNSPELQNAANVLGTVAFHLKISLDPFILAWRLPVLQKALKRILKLT